MSSFTLNISVGDVVRKVTVIEVRLDNPTDLMKDVLLVAIRSTQVNFDVQGRPQRWDDLAPSTIRRRFARAAKAKGASKVGSLGILGSIQILRNTGLLLQSVGGGASGPFSAGGGEGSSERFSMAITTNNPGAWNQFPNPRTGAPARKFLLWQDQDVEDVSVMQADFVLGIGAYAAG